MYSISAHKLMPKVLVVAQMVSVLLITCFQVNGQDKEIEEIHESAKELYSKLIACTKNQTKCNEFAELTTQIESNFAQGNRLPEENEQYIKLQQVYAQFKFSQKDTHLTEKEKNIPFKERVAKKYIGQVPEAIDDIIFYLQNYEKLSRTSLKAPNKTLLHGSPGTGKTHLIKTIAEELELPIIEINASNFYYGKNSIVNVFENLKKRDELTIVFIDDIDIIANHYSKERRILLTKLKNIKNDKKTFIFCATNNLESLDDNFKRKFITAQIKDLSLEERAQLFKKEFADNGKIIGDEFAAMLAQATSRTKYHPSEFIFSISNRDIGQIAISTLIKHQACLKNLEKGQCFLSESAEKAIRQMDKPANFSKWKNKYYEE